MLIILRLLHAMRRTLPELDSIAYHKTLLSGMTHYIARRLPGHPATRLQRLGVQHSPERHFYHWITLCWYQQRGCHSRMRFQRMTDLAQLEVCPQLMTCCVRPDVSGYSILITSAGCCGL